MLFEKQRIKLQKASIRYIIFIYFTLTALAASIFIGISLYSRLSGQMSATIREENQILINQITRSMEDYLRIVMKLSDSLYYGVIKNADLASGSIGSEMTLLYDNNKDNVENIALLSKEGKLLESVPAARLKTNVDVTGENWFTSTLEKTENMHFSTPHVQYIFDGSENQYRWVISLSRAVEITQGPSTDQGVLLIDIRYSSLEQLFDGVNLGNGGYVYLISSSGEIIYHPHHLPACVSHGLNRDGPFLPVHGMTVIAVPESGYLQVVLPDDSLYYGVVKNADLASGSIGSEMTLLYDNNKDNVENIALLSKEGKLLEAVPAARLKTNVDVTGRSD